MNDIDKFKFRAWDREHMHHFTFDQIYGGVIYPYDSRIVNLSDCQITQSTGEKDKNGNLIYEGDIVKNHNAQDEEPTHNL
jgi:uncharacterized phage protein (TIGR01671 family)